MSHKPDAHRLQLANYPSQWVIDTTFGDMDISGHINNVSLSRYYETGRSRFLIKSSDDPNFFKSEFSTMVAEYTIRFLREVNFPDRVTVGTSIGRIGNSSFLVQQALFVNEQCAGLSDASMVFALRGKPARIPDGLRKKMEQSLFISS